MCIHAGCPWFWPEARWPVYGEVRDIDTCPLLLRLIPPDIFLALRPWAALWISRGTIVEDAPVGRPGNAPLQEPLFVRKSACFFGRSSGMHEEDLSLDLTRINRFGLWPKPWSFIPEG